MTELSHTLFSYLDKDFKAEVLAAEMVEDGMEADRILIFLLGALKRPFSKDVSSIEEELSRYDHKEYTLIKTPREGIYDMLPEGLFHHPTAHKSARTEKELIRNIEQRRQEEESARKFFLPFEATINFLRIQMALYENKLDKRSHYEEMVKIFAGHWEIFRYLDARQANIFIHLIPIIHDIRDEYPVIETVMEMMFLLPVKISLRSQLSQHTVSPVYSRMGEAGVGTDLTTGNEACIDIEDELLVKVGPLSNVAFQKFTPGGANDKIMQLLGDYLLPAHLDVVTEFLIDEEGRITRLADEASDLNSMLGADTFL